MSEPGVRPVFGANAWHLLWFQEGSRKCVGLGGPSAQMQVNYQQADGGAPGHRRGVTQVLGKGPQGRPIILCRKVTQAVLISALPGISPPT